MIYFGQLRKNIPYIISMMFVILLVYAASSKLFAYRQFQVQLAQSLLLKTYAGTIAWALPIAELALSFFLLFEKYRRAALYTCLALMTLFTIYIVLTLNFSDAIPCSCGGVIAALGWKGHIIFNVSFIFLAIIGILFDKKDVKKNVP